MKCPPNTICIDKKGMIVLLFICIFIAYFLINYLNQKNDYITSVKDNLLSQQNKVNEQIEKRLKDEETRISNLEMQRENQQKQELIIPENVAIVNQNADRLYNPFLPPQRSPSNSSIYAIDFPGLGVPINIPTRGWSPDFQQIGVLANDKDNRVLPLFGRQVNNGGNKWWYYTMSDQNNSVKLPIKYKNRDCQDDFGCDEIYDGDVIDIPILNTHFKVSLYKFDKPRYIPYI